MSRSRRTNDNALVESKNASVVRKHLGYSHIPSRHAQTVSAFLIDILTPYLNFHRPCFFPQVTLDDKGRQRRRYPLDQMDTPYEKLKALPNAQQFPESVLVLGLHAADPQMWSGIGFNRLGARPKSGSLGLNVS